MFKKLRNFIIADLSSPTIRTILWLDKVRV